MPEIENPNPITPPVKKPSTRAPKLKIDGPMAKPEIEGINKIKTTPVATPSVMPKLTDQEKQLLSDDIIPEASPSRPAVQKLMPQSVIQRESKKPSHAKTVVVTIIILLILAMGGYEAYLWHMEKQAETGQTADNSPAPEQQGDTSIIMSPITDNGASSTPSSTPGTIASSTPATSTPPAATTPQIKVKDTPTGYLNVRATPSSAGTLITQIHPGETYPFSDKSNGWYKITLTDGSFGWVSGQYVTEQ